MRLLCLVLPLGLLTQPLWAAPRMESINRGLVAIRVDNGYFLSWRLWGNEPHATAFNLYRNGSLVNNSPLTEATSYMDAGAAANSSYTVKPVVNGVEGPESENARIIDGPYESIPLDMPQPQSGEPNYTPNDASVADLDGDGEYEIVLKQEQNPKDNSHEGDTYNTVLEAYELDGTFMWRIQLGYNIREGAHYTQFMVYDLDGDGVAEIAVKTADGTIDGEGKVIGDANARWANSGGYIMDGPEYFTLFDGRTGAELVTVDYEVPRGEVCDWGDPNCETYANRVDRFLAAVAYLDGENPSVIMCRGYYTRTVLVAYDWRNGELTQRWKFDTDENGLRNYRGQGNHSLSVADVDEDGKQEIIYGAATIDDDGSGLYSSGLGHGDAQHVSDLVPGRPGLEIWGIHEGTHNPGAALRDARTGEVLFQTPNTDAGRGLAADIDPDEPGAEFWQNNAGLFGPEGDNIGSRPGPTNFAVWWDGDLLRELLNGTSITKPAGGNMNFNAGGCSSNNGTKSTPTLSADLWGDWREEVILRCGDELRIFTSTFETDYKFHTLMHNPQYRMAIAWQNVAYNQPPWPDLYLGTGMDYPTPQPDITVGDITPVTGPGRRPYFTRGLASVSILNGKLVGIPTGLKDGDRVELFDVNGNVFHSRMVHSRLVDKPHLTNGVYFVRPAPF